MNLVRIGLVFFVVLVLDGAERVHRIYDAGGALGSEARKTLEGRGVKVLEYVGDGRYSVSVEVGERGEMVAARGLRLEEKRQKLGARVEKGQFPGWSQTEWGVMVEVRYWADVTAEEARAGLLGTGLRVLEEEPYFRYVRVAGTEADVRALARLDWVERVDVVPPPTKDDSNALSGKLIGADVAQGAAFNTQGQGVRVGVIDGGVVGVHREFETRMVVADGTAVSAHATHVAGTVAAGGIADASLKGIAPKASIYSYRASSFGTAAGMLRAQQGQGIQISQNSWSYVIGDIYGNCNDYSSYQTQERDLDQLVNDTGLLVVYSAGNDRDLTQCQIAPRMGFYSLTRPHAGKNILAVGAVDDQKAISWFSSAGPTKDGRLKPDVVTLGVDVRSTAPGNTTLVASGTSMAAPAATGAAALLMEKYKALNGANPPAALLRGLLQNTAQDLGNKGPDFVYGYGLLQVPAALTVMEKRQYQKSRLEGGTEKVTIEVPGGAAALRVMLTYSDAPGGLDATSAMVNVLGVKLIGPDGEARLPWYPDAANPMASAVPRERIRDTAQQVVVENPAAGTWQLEVTGVDLPAGAQEYWVNWSFEPVGPVACSATVSPTEVNWSEKAGTLLVNVVTPNECDAWTVNGGGGWANAGSTKPGKGIGQVKLQILENTGGSRRTAVDVAGQRITIKQSGVCTTTVLEATGTVSGALEEADCLTIYGTFAKQYRFSAKVGQRVAFVVESRQFDTYMELRNPQGAVVTADDDSGGGTNSRVPSQGFYTIPASGDYLVVVTSFDEGEVGTFQLTYSQGDATSLPMKDPTVLRACPVEVSGVIGSGSSRNSLRGDLFPVELYTFPGRVGQQVTVTLPKADFDSMIQLVSPRGQLLATYNDPASSGKAVIERVLVEEGLYRVEVTPYTPFGAGAFTLRVEGCTAP